MPIISIFSGSFCNKNNIIEAVRKSTENKLVTDKEIVAEASELSGISESKIERAFSAKTSLFNKFTHERERSIAYLKFVMAQRLSNGQFIIFGFTSHLIPQKVQHALRVCIIADMKSRIGLAQEEQGLSEDEAVKLIHRQDEDSASWTYNLFGKKDPWDISLYDIIIPSDKMSAKEAGVLVKENLAKDAVRATNSSKKAVEDFLLSSRVELALAQEGHNIRVSAKDGMVTLVIDKHVLLLSRLEEELDSIANKVPGVRSVEINIGPGFHQADIYRKYDFEMPSKILLVDDEREFVQTLSERLEMRDIGSAVTYDGASALDLVKEDEPDVMILDLKMPGIDGIEVLKRVKETQPEIEVIILTGHGSKADRETCMALGAFAYLQKPVDIKVLSTTIENANEKIRAKNEKTI